MNCFLKELFIVLFFIFSTNLFSEESFESFLYESYFSADFIQITTKDEDKRTITGTIKSSRSGLFKLVYLEPFKEIIASDSIDLYRYDPDLEQLEIHPLDDLVENSPVSILFKNKLELEKIIELNNCEYVKDKVLCVITFLNNDFSINDMKVKFKNNSLIEISYKDSFLQEIRILFSNQSNTQIDKNEFKFDVPEETDVISYKMN